MPPLLASAAPGPVIDAGCGEQPFRALIEAHARQYVGMDAVQNGRGSVAVLSDLESVPATGPRYPVVLCTEVLEHVADINRSFAGLRRLTAPGGCVVLTVPFTYPVHMAPFDFRRLTQYGIAQLADAHGFDIVSFERLGRTTDSLATLLEDASVCRRLPPPYRPRQGAANPDREVVAGPRPRFHVAVESRDDRLPFLSLERRRPEGAMMSWLRLARRGAGAMYRQLFPTPEVAAWRHAEDRARTVPRFTPCSIRMLDYELQVSDLLSFCPQWHDIFVDGALEFARDPAAPRILDCGGNVGLASLFFKRRYPVARITAYEADPALFGMLQRESCRERRRRRRDRARGSLDHERPRDVPRGGQRLRR